MSTQEVAAPPPFIRQVSDAMDRYQGAELAQYVSTLHEQEMQPVHEHARAQADMTAQIAQSASFDNHLLAAGMATIKHLALRQTDQAARAAYLSAMMAKISKMADASTTGAVTVEAIRDVLRTQPEPRPFVPTILAFTPDHTYKVGHFQSAEKDIWRAFPFAGWAMFDDHPERPATVQLAFNVDGDVLCRPQLARKFGLLLQRME